MQTLHIILYLYQSQQVHLQSFLWGGMHVEPEECLTNCLLSVVWCKLVWASHLFCFNSFPFRSFCRTVEEYVKMLWLWSHFHYFWSILGSVITYSKGKSTVIKLSAEAREKTIFWQILLQAPAAWEVPGRSHLLTIQFNTDLVALMYFALWMAENRLLGQLVCTCQYVHQLINARLCIRCTCKTVILPGIPVCSFFDGVWVKCKREWSSVLSHVVCMWPSLHFLRTVLVFLIFDFQLTEIP